MPGNRKVLLHTCCGPCATACIERLAAGREVVLFFSNSNIAPEDEYLKRLEEAKRLAGMLGLELLEDSYDHQAWLEHVRGLEDEPERGRRCPRCFEFSLARTAARAELIGIPAFTTTLSVSRHKSSPVIFSVGSAFERFEPIDFKKKGGWDRSLELGRHYGLYRQSYCGCEFSRRASKGG